MQYDRLSRKTVMTDTDMGTWQYRYDNAGNLIAQVDARQQAINFYYDSLNRLRGKTYATTATPAAYVRPADPSYNGYTVKYYYDESNYGYSIGQRTRLVDPSGSAAWTYDACGRVTQEIKNINGGGSFTTQYTYDSIDRVVTTTYPDGEVVRNTYNAAGQPATLRSDTYSYNYVSSASYTAPGAMAAMTYGNGLIINYDYYDDPGEALSFRLQRFQVFTTIRITHRRQLEMPTRSSGKSE